MSLLADHLFLSWFNVLPGLVCRADELPGGITRLRLSSRVTRLNGMLVAVYRVGGVLIDTGFAQAKAPLARALASAELAAICLTHHHEDHSGACSLLADRHRCPIYLRNPEARSTEGLDRLKPYRRAWWGEPEPYDPAPMPERVEAGDRVLRAVPIPGHSVSHTAFLDEASGAILVGDLFVSGGATAVMSHENPFESIASLRRVADLAPSRMLTGHGLAIERPVPVLREKAERIEQAAAEVLRLHSSGLPERQIVRRVFPAGRAKDRLIELLTQGEFSRLNFVRACTRCADESR
jgi:glyoxylase-like metal-dependent hydrolase (beta-lactamase superfamily II)